jgi:hypothetical protein
MGRRAVEGKVSMSLKANLKIVLHANNVVVAESEDPDLWQKVLRAMSAASAGATSLEEMTDATGPLGGDELSRERSSDGAVEMLARELNVSSAVLAGSCDPIVESPYIQLDKHHWEALKRNTPERGQGAVNATVLAATLLVLWKDCAKLGDVKLKETAGVIGTISLESKNPTRSVNNCEWLQLRNDTIKLNAAQTSKAIQVARAYCTKTQIGKE